jgi:hypothetical protein
MRNVSDTTGYDSYGEIPGQIRDSSEALTGKAFYQELIRKANTVPIINIFKHYGVRISNTQCTIICPFKSHKGGRENSGSFAYYPHTNSFFCFGCKVGGQFAHGCEFIAAMENISKAKAAQKILQLFSDDAEDGELFEGDNFSERLEIMISFSNMVRNFRQEHFDEKAHLFIEDMCLIYDDMCNKRSLDNAALRVLIDKLKEKIISYKPCLKP